MGMIKEVVVKYNSQENGCDILEPRYNGGFRCFYEKIINSVGGMNV